MSRTEMIFVDKEFRPLPFDRKVEERFAIFVRETNTHTCDFKKGANGWESVRNYISAVPFALPVMPPTSPPPELETTP